MGRSLALWAIVVLVLFGISRAFSDRTLSVQHGYRGTSATQFYKSSAVLAATELNSIPEADPIDDPDPSLPSVSEKFKNVQVLNDLSILEFSRLMAAFSTWVAPEEGCSYCHNPKNLASDEKYTKKVARRMIQMVRHVNNDWKAHVAETGVTCWTCHRGQSVPTGDWYARLDEGARSSTMGNKNHELTPGIWNNGNSALPIDPLSSYLIHDNEVRVQGSLALAGENRKSTVQTKNTYALMIYLSKSLGVNCNYCHATRAFADWKQSTPQRVTAWHGIRMVRELNLDYLIPVGAMLPSYRLGDSGDGPKVGCGTCHKGTFKPLAGVSMRKDYPELWRTGGPQVSTGYVSPPDVPVFNPVVPPERLMNGRF